MDPTTLTVLITELSALAGVVAPLLVIVHKIRKGMQCQLRSEMLRIYYNNHDKRTIRQYEYENFVMLYEAYKALKGNSFIDRIYAEVQEWSIIS